MGGLDATSLSCTLSFLHPVPLTPQIEHEEKATLKEERKRQQESNVRRKRIEALRKEADKVWGRGMWGRQPGG